LVSLRVELVKGVRFVANKDLVGKVIHYYDKIGVAVIKLEKSLKVGDKVKFVHGENSFEQTIESMQLEHVQVEAGKKGHEVAVKVNKEAKSGTLVNLA
jgi:putative protease